jgi:hypothetical protein
MNKTLSFFAIAMGLMTASGASLASDIVITTSATQSGNAGAVPFQNQEQVMVFSKEDLTSSITNGVRVDVFKNTSQRKYLYLSSEPAPTLENYIQVTLQKSEQGMRLEFTLQEETQTSLQATEKRQQKINTPILALSQTPRTYQAVFNNAQGDQIAINTTLQLK